MTFLLSLVKYIKSIIFVGFVGVIAWVFVSNWSFIFKKRIVGELVTVERIIAPVAVMSSPGEQLNRDNFSFSVAVKDLVTSEIHMASSVDRKWAAAQKGNCVVAAFFPYPPWRLDRGTTDHNARLLRNFDNCAVANQEQSLWEKIQFFFLWI